MYVYVYICIKLHIYIYTRVCLTFCFCCVFLNQRVYGIRWSVDYEDAGFCEKRNKLHLSALMGLYFSIYKKEVGSNF